MKCRVYLIECPVCRGQVSNVANFCPHCGTPMEIVLDIIKERNNLKVGKRKNKVKQMVVELKNDIVVKEFNQFLKSKSATDPLKWDEFKHKIEEFKVNIGFYNEFIDKCKKSLNLTDKQLTKIEEQYFKDSPYYGLEYYQEQFTKVKKEILTENKEPAVVEAMLAQMRYSYNLFLKKIGVINHYVKNPDIKNNYSEEIYEVVSAIDSKIKYSKYSKTPAVSSARSVLKEYGITTIINSIKNYYKTVFNGVILENSSSLIKYLDKNIDTCDADDIFANSGLTAKTINMIPKSKAAEPLEEYRRLFKLKK